MKVCLNNNSMKGEDFVPVKMHLSPPVTLAAVCTKVVVQLLIHCLLLLILYVGVTLFTRYKQFSVTERHKYLKKILTYGTFICTMNKFKRLYQMSVSNQIKKPSL